MFSKIPNLYICQQCPLISTASHPTACHSPYTPLSEFLHWPKSNYELNESGLSVSGIFGSVWQLMVNISVKNGSESKHRQRDPVIHPDSLAG